MDIRVLTNAPGALPSTVSNQNQRNEMSNDHGTATTVKTMRADRGGVQGLPTTPEGSTMEGQRRYRMRTCVLWARMWRVTGRSRESD